MPGLRPVRQTSSCFSDNALRATDGRVVQGGFITSWLDQTPPEEVVVSAAPMRVYELTDDQVIALARRLWYWECCLTVPAGTNLPCGRPRGPQPGACPGPSAPASRAFHFGP